MSSEQSKTVLARRYRARKGPWLSRAARAGVARLAAAVSLATGAGSALGVPAEYVWNGGDADWGDPTAWNLLPPGIPPGYPHTADDNATILSGQVNLDAAYSINAFTFDGGRLGGEFDLTTAGLFTWSGGAIVDAGTVRATAGMLITGAAGKILNARTIFNDAGVATWGGGDLITSNGAAVINTGTFVATFDGALQSQGGATFFVNDGVFKKTAGAGGTSATTIGAVFDSTGAVQVLAGRLALSGGGSASGTFQVAAGAALALRDGYTFAAGSGVGGAGDVSFEFGASTVAGAYAVGGVTHVAGGSVNFATAAATTGGLDLAGGVLTGTGTVTASGAVVWTGTVLQGGGAIVSNGTLDVSGGAHGLASRTLTNVGAGTWSGGDIVFSGGAKFVNAGTLDNTFAGKMQTTGANPGSFENAGLFVKSAGAETVINPPLTNTGTVRVSAGVLTLAGGGGATGRFDVRAGGRLRVINDFNFAAASRISGSGVAEFSGGVNTIAGTYDVTGGTEVYGGINTFSGNVVGFGDVLAMGGGFVVVNTAAVDANKFDFYGGILDGTGNVTFHGLSTWDSGVMKGAGTTTAAGGLVISGNSGKSLEGRTLVNAVGSSGTWSGGNMSGFGAGTFRNDGTLTNTFDASFNVANGTPQFYNTGLFIKDGGAGVTSFGVALNNAGTVRVKTGSIFVGAGSSTGNFDLLGGGVQFAGVYDLGDGATITGTNKATISGTLNVGGQVSAAVVEQIAGAQTGGAGTFTVGKFSMLGGRLTGGGTTVVTSTLDLGGDGKEVDGRTLRVNVGAVAAWPSGNISVSAGSKIDNAGTFGTTADGYLLGGGVFANSGVFVKSGSPGVFSDVAVFNNTGTVRVTNGSVYLGAGLSTGNFDLAGGPVLLSGYALGAGATTTGTNAVQIVGPVDVTGAASARYVTQGQGGTTSGPGTLTVEHFTWTGGQLIGAGATVVTGDATFAGGGKEMQQRTLRIAGGATGTWTAGSFAGFPGAVIDNLGTFQTDFDGSAFYAAARSASFNNAGLFLKSAGSGATTFDILFNNAGTARVAAGTLSLTGGGVSTGNFDLVGGTLELTGNYVLGPGTTVTGPGAANVIGPVTVGGAVSAKLVNHSAGIADGAGTLTAQTYNWTGGTLGGGGVTVVTAAVNLSGANQKTIDGRTLRVTAPAVATWSGGDVRAGGGGVIDNLGTFNATSDQNVFPGDGAPASFNNAGAFAKTGGAGFTGVFVPFNNSGVVRVQSGTLSLGAGGSATGAFELTAGPLELSGGYVLGQGATISGNSPVRIVGNVSVGGAATAHLVEQTAGAVSGAGTLTVDAFTWKGGSLAGAGTTRVLNTLSLSGGGYTIDGRTLEVAAGATAAWTSGAMAGANGGHVDNKGLFTTNFDSAAQYQTGVFPRFENTGEFRKTGGAGVTNFAFVFDNTGVARADTGTIRLAGGGSASGNFDVAAGAAVELAFDYTLAGGSTFTGPGVARVAGGVATVAGAVAGANVEQTAGVITGPGVLTAAQFAWKGGSMTGAGTTRATAGLTVSGNVTLDARALENAASSTATWTAGPISTANGGRVDNKGLFLTDFDGSVTYLTGAVPRFGNTGEFRKTGGAGATQFAIKFDNTGAVKVASGTLRLAGGGSASGTFDAAAGTVVEFADDYTLAGGATFTGAGTPLLTGGVTTVTGPVTAARFEQSAGTLAGGGVMSAGQFAWKGGTMGGAGTTRATAGVTLSGNSFTLDGRTLENAVSSTAAWTSGTIAAANAGRIDNKGLFTTDFDGSATFLGGAAPAFANSGEFRKTGGAGATQFAFRFDNTGVARVSAGTLRLAGGGSASGQFDLTAAGAAVELAADYTLAGGASFTGVGAPRLTGGVTSVTGAVTSNAFKQSGGTLGGAGTLTAASFEQDGGTIAGAGQVSAGTFAWKKGTLSGAGVTTATSALTITGTDFNLDGRTVAVAAGATGTWAAGDLRVSNGATVNNAGTFDIAADVAALKLDAFDGHFNNAGLLRKSGGAGLAVLAGLTLNNTGTLEVSSGTLIAIPTQFNTATGTLSGGTWRVLNGAKLDMGGAGITKNLANVTLDGPAANFPSINNLADNQGTFAVKGGRQFFTGPTFANAGTLTVGAASTMTFGNVFTNTGAYSAAGASSANFVFNTGSIVQGGALGVGILMTNGGTGTADIGGAQAWGAGAHLRVDGGTVILRTDAGTSAAPALIVDAKGGTTQMKAAQHLKGLNVDGGVVRLDPGGDKVLRTTGYAPGGAIDNWNGRLDLTNNRLVVDYAAGGSPLLTIRNQIKAGYHGGAWDGAGVVSSTAAANSQGALGYAEAAAVADLALAGFAGESLAGANAVVVRYTLAGDATLDGAVDFNDLVQLAQNYNTGTGQKLWGQGDFDYDGVVDFNDLVKLAQNYNTALAPGAVPAGAAGAAFEADLASAFAQVPEPGALAAAALAFGIVAPLGRRRRR